MTVGIGFNSGAQGSECESSVFARLYGILATKQCIECRQLAEA